MTFKNALLPSLSASAPFTEGTLQGGVERPHGALLEPPIALNREGLSPTSLVKDTIDFGAQNPPLSSPFRNFIFSTHPFLQKLSTKLSNCGRDFITLLNKTTLEQISIPLFCDNRVCLNPECQKHRLYKFMRAHIEQIKALNENMRAPKGWVFSDVKLPYPIDRFYCQERLKELVYLLDKTKHPKYGSNSAYSVHMEIKLNSDSWYLHFHGVSGGITNLGLVRRLWGKVIKYENAINPIDLGYYVSKYSSKVPKFPTKEAYLEYAFSTYKMQMHRFSCKVPPVLRASDWVIIERNVHNETSAFFELDMWLNKYLNDFGFGS
jgi:hypothetical protein